MRLSASFLPLPSGALHPVFAALGAVFLAPLLDIAAPGASDLESVLGVVFLAVVLVVVAPVVVAPAVVAPVFAVLGARFPFSPVPVSIVLAFAVQRDLKATNIVKYKQKNHLSNEI